VIMIGILKPIRT